MDRGRTERGGQREEGTEGKRQRPGETEEEKMTDFKQERGNLHQYSTIQVCQKHLNQLNLRKHQP